RHALWQCRSPSEALRGTRLTRQAPVFGCDDAVFRQIDRYARAVADFAVQNDAAVMGFGEALDHGKAQAGALAVLGDIVAAVSEALEHMVLVFIGDADAGVMQAERHASGLFDLR